MFRFIRSLLKIISAKPHIPDSLEGNELLEIILKRRSLRSFKRREIPGDVFAAILEAGRLAPSTVNLQTWSFAEFDAVSWRELFRRGIPLNGNRAVIVMGDTQRARSVMDAFPQSPLVEYTMGVMNASLAAMNMNIAAEALGVSSVMLSETGRSGLLDMAYLKDKLGLPDHVYPLMTIIFGYAEGMNPPMPPKLPLEQICFHGQYQAADPVIMQDWINQMRDGYKAAFPRSSFEKQLQVYQSKIGQAEKDLSEMIFGSRNGCS